MHFRTLTAVLLSASLFLGPARAEKTTVQLVTPRDLQPNSTFELRFSEPMIPAAQIGQTASAPPVRWEPAIKGRFVWSSQRSGIFQPEEPLALGTAYRVALAPGLQKADGQPLAADFSGTVQTPPLQLKGWHSPNARGTHDASAEPRYALLFNAAIEPSAVGPFCQYRNLRGDEIAARVERADPVNHREQMFPMWRSRDHSLLTWRDRFFQNRPAATGLEARPALTSAGNHLWVTPASPLPAGEGWRLILRAGLPAGQAVLLLPEAVSIEIGRVRPFTVTKVEATNYLDQGRRLTVLFSKSLGEVMTAQRLARWMRVDPQPADFKAQVSGSQVILTGAFELAREYRVSIDAGLPAQEPFALAAALEKTVTFEPVPPRIYFEEFATHQLSTGARRFHLLAVNVPGLRVSARLLAKESAPRALRMWSAYENPPPRAHPSDEEWLGKVEFDALPGRTVWEQEIPGTNAADEQRQVALSWDEILGAKKTGVVLLTAEQAGEHGIPGTPGAQALVQVTDLGVVWKQSKAELFTHVFSLAAGQAAAGAKVRLLDAQEKMLDEGTADGAGLARLKTNENAKWLVAEHGADVHVVDFRAQEEYLSLRRLGIREAGWNEEEDAADSRAALLFTERPVYKPGENVHLKGILRDWRENRARIPAGAKATLRASDPQERMLVQRKVTISDAGSFAEDIALPSSGLGTYSVTLVMDGDGAGAEPLATHEFEVQEFEPNAFEIKIPPAPRAVGEAKIALPIAAHYYMGKPLSQAQLSWSLTASDTGFSPAGFDTYEFCNAIHHYELNQKLDRVSHFAKQGKAHLDARGIATVEATIPLNPKAPQPRTAQLLCEITDLDQKTVSQSADFTIHSSDFYLGIRQLRGVVRQGEVLPIEVIALRTDGTPTLAPVAATLRLTRVVWGNHRVETAGGAAEYRHDARFDPVSESAVTTHALVKNEGKWALAAGEPSATLTAGEPGQYLIEAVSRDADGREVATAMSFHVAGPGATEWDYENQYQIDLVTDQEEYRSGQTAKILVKTPIAGEALVTIERDRVLRSFITKLSGNAPAVEVPLEDGDAPNVFVSVMMLRGAADSPRKFAAPEYRVGYCKLKVERPDAKLSVYVAPGAPSYRPGDEVRLGAQVLDFQGRPVAGAEVTLYAVDEGVLSLMGYETPDPLAFFNRERALAVTTGLTLPTLLSEDPEERTFDNKGYLVGGGGENAGEAMRKNFVACAFWNASLRTDAEGRIAAAFPAPDSLTRYRVMAVVQTARDQFGSGASAFEVNKPVMLEPALPRFANVGDKLILRGVLHNLTETAGEVEVALALDATATAAETTRRVALPARGSLAVDFPVEFLQAGTAVWKWTAYFRGAGVAFRDAVQTTLKVGYPVPLLRELRTIQTRKAEVDLLAEMNPALLEGAGVVRVSVTNSRMLELRESLERLLHYPYGCVEQTTSSTLPWISMRGFQGALPSLRRTDAEIAVAVNRGVDRLLSMQTSSGGLSYWPGDGAPLFWGSAYGGFGLAQARRAGFAVPEEPFGRLCQYLSEQLRGAGGDAFDGHYSGGGPSDRCLALYTLALAGRAEPAYHEALFRQRAKLSAENRALLALAVVESKGPAAMIAELLDPGQELKLPEGDPFWSRSRDTAMRLLAWCQHRPDAPAVGELLTELMGRRLGGHWSTTQGNCWSLLALSAYCARVEIGRADVAGAITWRGKREQFAVQGATPLRQFDFALEEGGARDALRLMNPEGKQLYTEVMVETRPRTLHLPAQDQGYALRRSYAKLADDGSLSELKEARVGDRVLVTLNLSVPRGASYLAVDDPLPAIFEAVNPVFKSQATRAGERLGREWVGDHQELRADRALFFADAIAAGEYTIRYLARVRAAGTATAPAAKAEEMYHPERFGLSETVQLTSLPLK